MKILAIRGENLASLEGEFVVDFTQEPLLSAGTFAITGPTGAGKSTLLDALCLALFDNAPRLNKAETSVNIVDVDDKTLTQKDSRSLLRRGTAKGYAEVDFIALSGQTYRARWSVRRARDLATGALQASQLSLVCIDSGKEEQGTKKVVLERITELIGLNFDQFTRAVLLAQGDFASFLQAKQNEKAELLEKLTGTEVYSRVSAAIYQKTDEAKKDLELVRIKTKGISVLDDEALAQHQSSLATVKQSLQELKQKQVDVDKKVNWLQVNTNLQGLLQQAEVGFLEAGRQLSEAAPRFLYLEKLDQVQEIAEVYRSLADIQQALEQSRKALADTENKQESLKQKQAQSSDLLANHQKALQALHDQWLALKPELEKARRLDVQLEQSQKEVQEAKDEYTRYHGRQAQWKSEYEQEQRTATQSKENIQTITHWFTTHQTYQPLVQSLESVLSWLDSLHHSAQYIDTTISSLQLSESSLTRRKNELEQLQKKEQELERLLPIEVLKLRKQLEKGNPCPVCGSLHHPYAQEVEQAASMHQEELENSILQVKVAIEKCRAELEQESVNQTKLSALLQERQDLYQELFTKLSLYIPRLSEEQGRPNYLQLQEQCKTLAQSWQTKEKELQDQKQALELSLSKLESLQQTGKQLDEDCTQKQSLYQSKQQVHTQQLEQRNQLLGKCSVQEVENSYQAKEKQINSQIEQQQLAENALNKQVAELAGERKQLEAKQQADKDKLQQLQPTLQIWLQQKDGKISPQELSELLAKTPEWIRQERSSVEKLSTARTSATAVLDERKQVLAKHQELAEKPLEELNQLVQLKQDLLAEAEKLENEQNRLLAALSNHEEGMKKRAVYALEEEKKDQYYQNWAKLNDLLGSATGSKFKTIAQGYTLDVLLDYANIHLQELSQRYTLEKVANTLALQVIDQDMLGEVRSVHSLSGGESFLISLSLALGLSSLSSHRMKIESLFIDEGFGALDPDTLSLAMDALDKLQTYGRKVGVISHVEEMKERIGVQVQVHKQSSGKSSVKIVG